MGMRLGNRKSLSELWETGSHIFILYDAKYFDKDGGILSLNFHIDKIPWVREVKEFTDFLIV